MKQTEKLNFKAITEQIVPIIEPILQYFDVDYIFSGNRFILQCPIHGSDNKNSVNIFTTGEKSKGNFVCWTKHCEADCGNSVLFIIKALLENKYGTKYSIYKVVDFLESKFKINKNVEFVENPYDYFLEEDTENCQENGYNISRELVRKELKIPSLYFLKRGFKKETLDYFDVGTCYKKGYQMFNRAVVPIYTLDGNSLVGYVGRSQYEICHICNYYHSQETQCPNNQSAKIFFHKWINSAGFRAGNHLYNSWNAKSYIEKHGCAVLVEGQGDVWKLHEAGIPCGMGTFGDKITKRQFNLLNKLGVQDIYLAFDNDDAGRKCTEKSIEHLYGYFNVHPVKLKRKDIGEHSIEELKEIFYDYRDCWK